MNDGPTLVDHPKVLRNVQALRAAAALLVLFEHFGNSQGGIDVHYLTSGHSAFEAFTVFGLFGVDIFFVISGFIIYVTTRRNKSGIRSGAGFLVRRCIRIYPPYWLVFFPLVAVYLLAPRHFTQFHSVHDNLVASFLLLPQVHHPLLAVSWTLVFEMYFYLIFAVLLLAPRRAVRPLLVCWFVLQLLCCALLRDSGGAAATFFKNPIAVEFIFGIIVGILYEHNVFPAPRAAFWTASGVCLVLWLASDRLGDMPGIERIFIWGVPAACLVYGVIGIERVRYAVSPASLVSLGDASYALYLWHLPVLILLGQVAVAIHLQGAVVHGVLVIGMLAAVIVFSLGMYRYAERPLTQYLSGLLERNARQSKVIAEIHDLTIIKRQSHEVN